MKYYEHELYIRRKHAREQVDRFFKIFKDDCITLNFENYFNDLAVEVLNNCLDNNDRAFSKYVYLISNRLHIQNRKIEKYDVYLMTKKQIQKHLKDFDYEVSESFMERYSYRYYRIYAVFIKGVKNDWK